MTSLSQKDMLSSSKTQVMKGVVQFLEWNFQAFGPFTNRHFDFSKQEHGLHLIYGPNEAGKSSSLRALNALLFGIPMRSQDDFLHDYGNMRLGAILKHSEGDIFKFWRRKGSKNNLLDEQEQPLNQEVLQQFLGGLTEERFTYYFGLNYENLLAGSEALQKGEGQVGEGLFAASLGMPHLRNLLESLDGEAQQIFRPKGKKQFLNHAIRQYHDLKKESQELSFSSLKWVEHEQAWKQARQESEKLLVELEQIESLRNRLQRFQKAAPLFQERYVYQQQLVELGEVPSLSDDFGELLQKNSQNFREAQSLYEHYLSQLKELDAQVTHVPFSDALLPHQKTIELLQERRGGYLKAQMDLPKLEATLTQLKSEASEILRDLWDDETLDSIQNNPPKRSVRHQIQKLAKDYQVQKDRLLQTKQQLLQQATRYETLNQKVQKFEVSENLNLLQQRLQRIQKLGNLDQQKQKWQQALEEQEFQSQQQLRQLFEKSLDIEEFELLRLPLHETIEHHAQQWVHHEQQQQRFEQQQQQNSEQRQAVEQQIKGLQLSSQIPTEQELGVLRKERDQSWKALKLNLENNSRRAPEEGVADFEAQSRECDLFADRLRREAERVAQLAHLVSRKQQLLEQHSVLQEQYRSQQQQWENLQVEWKAVWQVIPTVIRTPKEMKSWLQHAAQLQQVLQQRHHHRRELQQTCLQIQRAKEDLQEFQSQLKLDISSQPLDLLVEHALSFIEEAHRQKQAYEQQQALLEETSREQQRLQKQYEDLRQSLQHWESEWREALTLLMLSEQTPPEEALNIIDCLESYQSKQQLIQQQQLRVEGIIQEAIDFRKVVRQHLEEIAPELQSLAPEDAIIHLSQRYQDAAKQQALWEEQQKQRQQIQSLFEQQEVLLKTSQTQLNILLEQAECENLSELESFQQKLNKVQGLKKDLQRLEKQLYDLCAGSSLDEFEKEVNTQNIDDIPGQLEHLRLQLQEVKQQYEEKQQAIGREKTLMEQADGGSKAAEAAEQAQSYASQIQNYTEHFLALRLASSLLNQSIESYRQSKQAPLLFKASQLFKQLTLGSFEAIHTDYNDQDELVFVGIRPEGQRVLLDGMSDGSRDQLYLALRLASLENYYQHHEAIPLVIDDLLINFDDARSVAFFEALKPLAEKTQIFLFTHHQHLQELVHQSFPKEKLMMHTL